MGSQRSPRRLFARVQMTSVSTLSPPIRTYLHEFVARARWVALARSAASALAGFLGWMLIFCAIDRFAQLHWTVRLAALLAGAIAVIAIILPRLVALAQPADLVRAAAAVERQSPLFGQRLLTVTSRHLGAADYRGSDAILLRLTRDVGDQVATTPAARLIPLRPLAAPLAVCLLLAVICAGLLGVPSIGFGRLAGRFGDPLANIPPVTTTTLEVSPGNLDVTQSRAVTIAVRADRLGAAPVMLFLTGNDRNWTRITMSPAGGGQFTFNIASVDRDLRYYVAGGDARSPDYSIRVLRAPVVSQFRIGYDYPSYTRLPPTTATNTDGRIEALAGTKVRLEITSTEPLQSAILTIGGERLLMDRGHDPSTRTANLVVATDQKYSIDLISSRDVTGAGPPGAAIRAVPDLPPQVRLTRGGDSLHLGPREIIPIWYEAIDDYGLKSLAFQIEINEQSPVLAAVRLWGDPRRQQDKFILDLATLPLAIGDVVKVLAIATDTAGHTVQSPPLRVIISPRAIDLDAWERIGELRTANQLCQSLVAQFDDAIKARAGAESASDHASSAVVSAESRCDRALSAASQTATLLRQSLLRAVTHSRSATLSISLAGWVDAAEMASIVSDEAFRQSGAPGGMPAAQRDRVRAAMEQIRAIGPLIASVEQGEQALAILADYENLQAARKRPVTGDVATRQRTRETIERMRQDIADDASHIGLHGESSDLKNQLRARIHNQEDVLSVAKPIDFATISADWGRQIRTDPQRRLGLEARLSAAAQAEALRSDADLVRARDLELASRAAAALVASARGGRLPSRQTFETFASDLTALLRAGQVRPNKSAANDPRRLAAEQDLHRLTEDPAPSSTRSALAASEDRQKDAESLALQASAAAAEHRYSDATKLDQSMVRRLEQLPRQETLPASGAPLALSERLSHQQQTVQQEMVTARTLDDLEHRQDALATDAGRNVAPADGQLAVADQIAEIEHKREQGSALPGDSIGNGRDRAASQVLAAQDQLSAMPQALASALTVAAARREAAMRPDERAAADRAQDAADQNADEATARLNLALDPISPKALQGMAGRLEPYAPETDAARSSLLGQLAPALNALAAALRGDDPGAADRCADEARRAIESCQRDLAAAQNLLLRRDPLVVAKWFARAAAQSLAMVPPDVGHARSHQVNASMALSRAWDQSIHKAATERLASLPSLSALLAPLSAPQSGQSGQQGSPFAAAREWTRMRPQDGPDVNTSLHDADPAGFEASLKLYFEALGKAQEGK
jgi:hypothetical protein